MNPNDPVDIPDPNFLAALIERGVDTNGDSIIAYAEAETVTLINVSGKWRQDLVTDMTGIEKFINLDTLICDWNQITTLDVSNNTALKYLDCSSNDLSILDVSNNTAIVILRCAENQLTDLDITNQLDLHILDCSDNQLTSLDLSNNSRMGPIVHQLYPGCELDIRIMPSLEEVCVWKLPFPPEGFKLCMDDSPNVYFTMDCSSDLP